MTPHPARSTFSAMLRKRGEMRNRFFADKPHVPGHAVSSGHCVACGRQAERNACVCPYCGERVWRPWLWHAARCGVLLLPPALLVGAAFRLTAEPGWHALFSRLRAAPPAAIWLAASALGLLALPADTDGSVAGTDGDLRRQQVEALLGGAAQALYTVTGAVLLAAAPRPSLPVLLLAVPLFAGAAFLPFFLRIPRPRPAAAAALAAAAAASIL